MNAYEHLEKFHFYRLNPKEVSRSLKALETARVPSKRQQEWLENEQAELLKRRQFCEE